MQLNQIKSDRETLYFVLSLILSIFVYIGVAISVVGIAIALIVFAFIFYMQLMMLGSIRGNGVRIHQNQFPDVYTRVQQLSKEMGLKKTPDVFVIQSEGALNAFATRFLGRDMVVLYSEVFELAREQGQNELDFIIAHELAHVKRRHVWKNLAILPAAFIPFLSQAYSRSCEYTCDRHAAFMIRNPEAAKRALTLLGIGKKVYTEVNEQAYMQQIETESNGIVWLTEVLSTHPRLPKRIQSISQFAGSAERLYYPRTGRIIAGVAGLTALGTAIYIACIALFAAGGMIWGSLFAGADALGLEQSLGLETAFETPGETDLMTAAYMGDIEAMDHALAAGDSIDEQDDAGADALMYAVNGYSPQAVEYLLELGANPNTYDDVNSALVLAVFNEDKESVELLLEYGADPSLPDPEGFTIFDATGESTVEDVLESISW
ncbi:heat-shock protein HtpX [Chryseomicrobium excrementi]|uniref:Heat-shock protein HtpX n=1 Tax=Chryseomicrobium excrementi TaxID=2041346 RepID=A0A2M9EYM5_9BACL|nr:M48 family metallopeptidase [Chryseomicrobium excrementi]PJK16300.1 heat-shock protein HtpX [Chryseomicrobium excrementi]